MGMLDMKGNEETSPRIPNPQREGGDRCQSPAVFHVPEKHTQVRTHTQVCIVVWIWGFNVKSNSLTSVLLTI